MIEEIIDLTRLPGPITEQEAAELCRCAHLSMAWWSRRDKVRSFIDMRLFLMALDSLVEEKRALSIAMRGA